MPRITGFSIRTTICLVLSAMGLIILSYATTTLIEVRRQAVQSAQVATLAQVSRASLNGLLATRLARGVALQGMSGDSPADGPTLDTLDTNDRLVRDATTEIVTRLWELDLPAVGATLGRLQEAQDAVTALRPRLDKGIRLSKTEREAGLPEEAKRTWQEMLDALSATADAVDAAISLSDPVLRRNLEIKRAAWAMRMASGAVGLRLQSTLAAGRSWPLAEQTARATEEISGQIAGIQASTGGAVTAIGAITARIREISGVATTIAAAVEQQGAATQEIVRNVGQAAAGTGEVTSNIAGVAGAADETGRAAGQVLSAATELSRQSEHLTAEVARFLDTVRAA